MAFQAKLIQLFPELKDGFEITSRETPEYNCIAWAARDDKRFWWPENGGFWPIGAPRVCTIEAFEGAFRLDGYERTASSDLEDGIEKVALYALGNKPKHMARQLPNGAWTSKLGQLHDISHPRLESLDGEHYGTTVLIMKRPRPTISS